MARSASGIISLPLLLLGPWGACHDQRLWTNVVAAAAHQPKRPAADAGAAMCAEYSVRQ